LLLEHRADDGRGLRREDLIARDASPEHVAADRAALDAWTARREATTDSGARPSLLVQTATEFAAQEAAPDIEDLARDVAIEDTGALDARPSGRRFGTLVHAVLATVPLDASIDDVRAGAELHATLLAATDEERGVAAVAVDRVLRHPRLAAARDARAAGRRVWREYPLSIVTTPRSSTVAVLVDGQCDLAYEDRDGWVVVDFKTDVVLSASDDAYRRQLAHYADAIARATGRPARGVLLRV
jgi:ATP-dependent exoDNAse (exonuclease V) beta subunit